MATRLRRTSAQPKRCRPEKDRQRTRTSQRNEETASDVRHPGCADGPAVDGGPAAADHSHGRARWDARGRPDARRHAPASRWHDRDPSRALRELPFC